ncbi:GNAT family N-acetyltransferase [Nonomuraea sp. SYSU D8015]|uniref:GNAT family N-acetyltransferase n=1 Tax=Nonomuraea sp. SYSU D8015 TaxID=2593644 RepID=UPI001CB72F81|nr:GNAT family N-acetyltransferase [Nonomuraea sp. SYSU D8015]
MRHVVDLAWRLSSPAARSGRHARVWQDAAGQAVGFAAWQPDWATLDLLTRPGPQRGTVLDAIFAGAERLFRRLDEERGEKLPYWIEYREDDEHGAAVAAAYGYTTPGPGLAQLEHPLTGLAAQALSPRGCASRVLVGAAEADAYARAHRAAFASESMTGGWKARTLRVPGYRPDLDLVAVAPDETLAGFCVGWFDADRRLGQVEPLGVDPRHRRAGLGGALLGEMLHRFRALGARRALVETDPGDAAAVRLYESAGFRFAHAVRRVGRVMAG